jgi:uncharacterized membrane protein required for colicin V production
MKMQDFGFGWIDLLIAGLLVAGVVRGRKRGISEELLDVLKWVLIVIAAAFSYQPLGSFLSGSTPFSQLSSYVATYAFVAVAFVILFSFLRRAFGGKLIGGDIFGAAEYYLGMCAGAVRYACIILVMMALLNARYYSPAEVRAHIKYQEDNFGSVFFPSVCAMQREVFDESWTGRLTRSYLGILLIKPTAPEDKGLAGASVIKARERNIFDVLEK